MHRSSLERAQRLPRALLTAAVLAAALPAVAAADDPGAIRVLLVARMETTLSSQMSGTIGELQAELGQKVAKNALLAQFICTETQARAKVAGAELNMARQNLDAKQNLKKLNAAGDLEVLMATTEVEKTEGALTLARTQAGYCQVRAPFGGRIAKVLAKPHQTVSAGTPMFDLVSDGPLKVRLNVPSTLLSRLKPGTPVAISIHETGKSYPAQVSAINARVDAVAQTVELEARLNAEHPELIPGMSGIARFSTDP